MQHPEQSQPLSRPSFGEGGFETFFSQQLNPSQQQAVAHREGPLLVVAGAGSGKTRVITARITNLLLNEQVSPVAIVALTFTNKAAHEMKERIAIFLGNDKTLMPFIGTFHSYCLQLLKKNIDLLDRPPFTILDADDQQRLMSQIIKRFGVGKKITAKQTLYHISKIKNAILAPEEAFNYESKTGSDQLIGQLHRAYESEKKASNCLDFDDLLLETLVLFQKNPTFRDLFQSRVRHVLVDEYQDTNVTQHELLKYMALNSKKKFAIDSLCAVGDEDQSIYSWRGATVANIMNFKKDFAGAVVVTIDQNYRSAQPILDAANSVIDNNQKRNPKNLWSDKKGSDRIRALSCLSGYQEADAVACFVQALGRIGRLDQVAILYRAHYQSRSLEEACIKNSIPYRIIGGIQFYERAEIKDVLAYLRLLVNPYDRISFFRIINTPSRGFGEKFEEQVYEIWNKEQFWSFKEVCTALLESGVLTSAKKESLKEFLALFSDLSYAMLPSTAAQSFITRTQYLKYLKDEHDPEDAVAKCENVKELIQAMKHFEEQGKNSVSSFLDEVALMQEKTSKKDGDQNNVQLMTLHAAKGLEFDTVIITGLEEGLLPSGHALTSADAIEEERRLMYVGITRAKERLLLTNARYRHVFGQMEHQLPSRFVEEIPTKLVSPEDCASWTASQFQTFFHDWLKIKHKVATSSVLTFGAKHATVKPTTFGSKPASRPSATSSITSKSSSIGSATSVKPTHQWKKNQPVKHASFGIGIIQKIEEKSDSKIYITAQFKTGSKKVDASFLEKV